MTQSHTLMSMWWLKKIIYSGHFLAISHMTKDALNQCTPVGWAIKLVLSSDFFLVQSMQCWWGDLCFDSCCSYRMPFNFHLFKIIWLYGPQSATMKLPLNVHCLLHWVTVSATYYSIPKMTLFKIKHLSAPYPASTKCAEIFQQLCVCTTGSSRPLHLRRNWNNVRLIQHWL